MFLAKTLFAKLSKCWIVTGSAFFESIRRIKQRWNCKGTKSMKRTRVIICFFAFLLALGAFAVQSPSKTATLAGQSDQQLSRQFDQLPATTGKTETHPPTDHLPMASIDDQARSLAADLELGDDQQARLKALLQVQQQQVQAVVYDRSLSQEERMDKFRSLNDALVSNIRKLLNDDQKKKFDQRTGKNRDSQMQDSWTGSKSAALEKSGQEDAVAPKLAVGLQPASYKFKVEFDNGGQQESMNLSTTIREDNGAWTATDVVDMPNGQMTDISTLERRSLKLRKRTLKQGSVVVNLDFSDDKAGGSLSINGVQQPISADLGGPLFADSAGWPEVIACLPLAEGYVTSFRNFDLQKHRSKLMQLKVAGVERVTVPAGTFEAFRVELVPADGGPEKSTVWIAIDSRKPVKVFAVLGSMGKATMNAELIR
jgi:cell division protein FtsB